MGYAEGFQRADKTDCFLVERPQRSLFDPVAALKLEVKNVDFSEGTLTIEHLKYRIRLSCPECSQRLGKAQVFCPRCGAGVEKAIAEERERRRMRTLPVDRETLQLLRNYISRGGPVSRHGKQIIFGINRHRAWQITKECAGKAGLGVLVNPETGRLHNVSPHRLRDAFAVMAMQQDDFTDSIRMLQEQLGYVSIIATTMRYRKVAGREPKQWYQKLWEKQSGA